MSKQRTVYLKSKISPSRTDWHRGKVIVGTAWVEVNDGTLPVSLYPLNMVERIQ